MLNWLKNMLYVLWTARSKKGRAAIRYAVNKVLSPEWAKQIERSDPGKAFDLLMREVEDTKIFK